MNSLSNLKSQISDPRLPAEWEPHAATWLAWPTNKDDWPGKFEPIPWVYAEIVRGLTPGERVRMLVQSSAQARRARVILSKTGVDLSRVDFYECALDRGWMRDIAPCFVAHRVSGSQISNLKSQISGAAVIFDFNGWAKYDDWHKDVHAASFLAGTLGLETVNVVWRDRPVILEGGAIDTNGRGMLLATEECLMDRKTQARNPGLSKCDYERIFRKYLGITDVIWLGKGIVGDDTHGHIDDVCRFVNAGTVVLCHEDDPADPNYRPLAENRERLVGGRLDVVALPMPAPVIFDGMRVPASYANFYIANTAVLVPTFNDKNDRIALGILAELFPERDVIGIYARDLVWGLGTIHCLSHEEPAFA